MIALLTFKKNTKDFFSIYNAIIGNQIKLNKSQI